MGNFSQQIRQRLCRPTPVLPVGEQQLAMADGRKLWVTRLPRPDWPSLQPGHQLLVLRTGQRYDVLSLEPCEVMDNRLAHPTVPCLALVWGWVAPGEPDTRHATILLPRQLDVVLRYELRNTATPDVVATILPNPN